jgi:NADH-quinone oxidoreductase subunit E
MMAKAAEQRKGSNRAGSAGVVIEDLDLLKGYLLYVNTQLARGVQEIGPGIDPGHFERLLEAVESGDGAVQQIVHELHAADDIIDKHDSRPDALIQILLDIQDRFHWLPENALRRVQQRLNVPSSRIYHIATFYKAFQLVPQGKHLVQVCLGTACQVKNAPRLLDQVSDLLKIKPGETDKDHLFTLGTVFCMGCCALGPVLTVDGVYCSRPTADTLKKLFASYK